MSGRAFDTVAVVVPAHDERDLIGACLASLRAQTVPARVVVVLDACTDDTATACGDVETVEVPDRCVGAARAAGVRHILRDADPATTWLASTDADTEVPPGWLAGMLAVAAQSNADLVLGTAVPQDFPEYPAWRAGYTPADGHRHVHGANLGIRADAYLRVGGWPALVSGEDVELARRAVAAGLRIARTAAIPVRTSARLVGRAPNGFAAYLASLDGGSGALAG